MLDYAWNILGRINKKPRAPVASEEDFGGSWSLRPVEIRSVPWCNVKGRIF